MKNCILRFLQSQRGVTSLEYALLASLISVVIVVAVSAAGDTLSKIYSYVKDQVVAARS